MLRINPGAAGCKVRRLCIHFATQQIKDMFDMAQRWNTRLIIMQSWVQLSLGVGLRSPLFLSLHLYLSGVSLNNSLVEVLYYLFFQLKMSS